MQSSTKYVDTANLKWAENTYREQLKTRPEDMAIRLSLAWCLFMQALHRSGQETVLDYAVVYVQPLAEDHVADSATIERSAHALLKDCLHQTYMIKHLSLDADERLNVARLQSLVELAGARDIMVGAEEQSVQQLVSLAREALLTPDCHP